MGRDREAGMPHTICWTVPLVARMNGYPGERLAGSMGIVCLAGAREMGGEVG